MLVRPSAIPSCVDSPRCVTRESASTASSSLRSRCDSMSMTGLPTGVLDDLCALVKAFLRVQLATGQHVNHRLARAFAVIDVRRRVAAVRDLTPRRFENFGTVVAGVHDV